MKKTTLFLAGLVFLTITACTAQKTQKDPDPVIEPELDFDESSLVYDKTNAVTDSGSKAFNASSAIETVKAMRTGWNLGNTLDATGGSGLGSETSWGQPKTTKEMIDALAASGMKSIRIPTSWHNHITDSNYTIDPKWMERVKEIVDWAIENDMYVILNSHHDNHESPSAMKAGQGYYPNSTNYEESKRFLENVWSQICLAFNNGYDEHLIFETMNEPRLVGTNYEWWFDPNAQECKDAADTLNKLNQVALNTIRSSGGNNAKRFVACPGLQASPDSALADAFKMPEDIAPGHLIVSVHMYTPYKFAMESPGATEYTQQMKNENATTFKKLKDKFIANGYAVYIGEYGATNKNNLDARVEWFKDFIQYTTVHGIPCMLWDNGVWQVSGTDYNEHFGFFDRKNLKWYFPEILDAIVEKSSGQ